MQFQAFIPPKPMPFQVMVKVIVASCMPDETPEFFILAVIVQSPVAEVVPGPAVVTLRTYLPVIVLSVAIPFEVRLPTTFDGQTPSSA